MPLGSTTSPIERIMAQLGATATAPGSTNAAAVLSPQQLAAQLGPVASNAATNAARSALPFMSAGAANTAAGLGGLYSTTPVGAMAPGVLNSAASVGGLYGSAAPVAGFTSAGLGGVNTAASVGSLYGPAGRAATVAGRAGGPFAGMAARLTGARAAATGAGGLAGGVAGGLTGGMGAMAAARTAAPWLLAGQVGGMGVDAIMGNQNGTMDDALENAARGAGMGAAVGSIVPVIGTGVGALVGGGAGALYGALTGRDSDETERSRAIASQSEKLTDLLNAANASPEMRQQISGAFQVTMATVDGGRNAVNAAADQLMAQLPAALMQDQAQQQAERERATNIAATQAWMGPMLQEQLGRVNFYADTAATGLRQAASGLSPELRGAYEAMAGQYPADVARGNAAMLQQLALTPSLYGYNTGINQQTGAANSDLASVLGALTPEQMAAVG